MSAFISPEPPFAVKRARIIIAARKAFSGEKLTILSMLILSLLLSIIINRIIQTQIITALRVFDEFSAIQIPSRVF